MPTGTPRQLEHLLHRRGDVAFGVRARRERWRRVLLGVVGLILVLCAVLVYSLLRPLVASGDPDATVILARCVSCGYEGPLSVQAGRSDGAQVCPKCRERAAYKLWECRNCGAQFLPAPGPGRVACPSCRSVDVGSAKPRPDATAPPPK
ncbi:MAG: hypothetical protein IPM13_14035 [Phycisphaerales bacterium]|nr:hypothetical protein [Phycisphaerales bacterium]